MLLKMLREAYDEPSIPPIQESIEAVQEIVAPQIDWYEWECSQMVLNGYVFWLDHYRYEGTDYPFNAPSEESRRKVFKASLNRAIAKYGRDEVNKICVAVAGLPDYQETDPRSSYYRHYDPIEYLMQQRLN